MVNYSMGRTVARKTWEKAQEEFDLLPLAVKAAYWDAVVPWSTVHVVREFKKNGAASVIRLLRRWDSIDVADNEAKRRQAGKIRPGTRNADLPPTPHVLAGASILRSHEAMSRPLMEARA